MTLGAASLQMYVRDKKYEALHQLGDLTGRPRRLVALWSAQHDTGQMRMKLTSDKTGTKASGSLAELCTVPDRIPHRSAHGERLAGIPASTRSRARSMVPRNARGT